MTLTSASFTREAAVLFQKSVPPSWKTAIARDLEIDLISPDGDKLNISLQRAWQEASRNPAQAGAVLARFAVAVRDAAAPKPAPMALPGAGSPVGSVRDRIVPLIKPRSWYDGMKRAVLEQGGEADALPVCQKFNEELIVAYSEPQHGLFRFIRPDELAANSIAPAELRTVAVENLRKILPPMQAESRAGFHVIKCGGVYESSLLLFDSLWAKRKLPVEGEYVVAVPAEGFLLVTGSAFPQGIDVLRRMAHTAFTEGGKPISGALYVYRDGRFTRFAE